MSLEVPIKKNDSKDGEESVYWVASIVMACGPLLRLRYFGGDDRSLEFWFNLTKEAAHELGWSVKNDKRLEPPDIVLERSPDCSEKLQEFLTTAKSIPFEMLSGVNIEMIHYERNCPTVGSFMNFNFSYCFFFVGWTQYSR